MLLRANPDYHRQIGHVRVFEYATIRETFENYGWKVEKLDTSRGIANLYLWCLFRLGISLDDQMGTVKGWHHWVERFLLATTIWFDKNIWNTFLKWIPLWIVTLPIGWIISRIFPKTVSLNLCKK
jgi:hypothetical protein